MKQVTLIAMILLMAGMVDAHDDPNSMPRPTLQNPVTACFEHDSHTVTFKMKFTANVWVFITSDDSFESYVKKYWYGGVTSFRRKWVVKQMEKLTNQQIIEAVIKAESE